MIQRTTCPISGDPSEVIFSRPYALPEMRAYTDRCRLTDKLAQTPYEIRFCPTSGLHFQTWVMDESELAELYSPPADEKSFMEQIGKYKLHWFVHMTEEILVMRQMIDEPTPVVLDFGCNWGKWASMALAHGCDTYGLDVNRDAAAFCAARGIKMLASDQLGVNRFDFINVDQVMEHLSEPLGIIRLLASALKPGGFLKLSTPDNTELPRQLRDAQSSNSRAVLEAKTINSLHPLEHVNLFSNTSLRLLGEAAGLYTMPLPFFKWLGAGQLWNVPRQFNRNLFTPWKRWRTKGTYLWFVKPT